MDWILMALSAKCLVLKFGFHYPSWAVNSGRGNRALVSNMEQTLSVV